MNDPEVSPPLLPAGPATPPAPDAAALAERRKRLAKRVAKIVAAVLALPVLAWVILYVTKGRFLKGSFERIASQMSQRQVRVGGDFQFYFNIIDAKFYAEGLTVSNPAWAGPRNFFEARFNR